MRVDPSVTVVVPTHNAGLRLLRLVDALDRQVVSAPFEVVVVDDGSTDGSVDLLPRRPWLRLLREPHRNSYAARNCGCREARSDVIAFTDADCRPMPEWLAAGLRALAQADIVAGRIEMPRPPRPTVWTFIEADDWRDQELALKRNVAETANLFVRHEWFQRAEGFDEALPSGGDHDFVRRTIGLGARAVYAPDCLVLHDARASGRDFLAAEWRRHRAVGYRAGRSSTDDGPAAATSPTAVRRRRPRRVGRLCLAYVPIAPTFVSRRRAGRPLFPMPVSHDDVRLGLGRRALAFLLLYWLLPAWDQTAELAGRLAAARSRRRQRSV